MELNKVYNEDCMETMSRMKDKEIDLILTDPPYGIGLEYDIYEDTLDNWKELLSRTVPEMCRVAKMVIFPGAIGRLEWIYEKFPPSWIICWYKGALSSRSAIGFSHWEAELVWGKTYSTLKMVDYFQCRASPKKGTFNHPCPKPLEWAEWLISKPTKPGMMVYDPFLGSGTVAVVAKQLGRNYLGSEISPTYCAIAQSRIDEAVPLTTE